MDADGLTAYGCACWIRPLTRDFTFWSTLQRRESTWLGWPSAVKVETGEAKGPVSVHARLRGTPKGFEKHMELSPYAHHAGCLSSGNAGLDLSKVVLTFSLKDSVK